MKRSHVLSASDGMIPTFDRFHRGSLPVGGWLSQSLGDRNNLVFDDIQPLFMNPALDVIVQSMSTPLSADQEFNSHVMC